MFTSSVDRIKARISTSHLSMTWSVITGNLESIISLPEKFEWIGKSDINISFLNEREEKLKSEILDLDFSEYYDEKTYGILQTLQTEHNRVRVLYYGLKDVPAIFIRHEILFNTPIKDNLHFVPFCFNSNKEIEPLKIRTNNKANKQIGYIISNSGNTLLFYFDGGIDISTYKTNNEIQTVMIKTVKKDNASQVSNIKLPLMYICSLNSPPEEDIPTIHYKILETHNKYEKWLNEKK